MCGFMGISFLRKSWQKHMLRSLREVALKLNVDKGAVGRECVAL